MGRPDEVAEVFAVVRNASVPMIRSTPEEPNVAPTLWRTAIDHRSLTYYWEATDRPNVFWNELANLDLGPGAAVKRLEAEGGPVRSRDSSSTPPSSTSCLRSPEVAWARRRPSSFGPICAIHTDRPGPRVGLSECND